MRKHMDQETQKKIKQQAKEDAKYVYNTNALYSPVRWYKNYSENLEYENSFHMWLNYYLREGVQ